MAIILFDAVNQIYMIYPKYMIPEKRPLQVLKLIELHTLRSNSWYLDMETNTYGLLLWQYSEDVELFVYPHLYTRVWQSALKEVKATEAFVVIQFLSLMTKSNGNIFRVAGLLCGEFTGVRWILRTKASDAELWCFLLWMHEQAVE